MVLGPFYSSRIFPIISARDSFSFSSFAFSLVSFFSNAMSFQQSIFSLSCSSEISICFFRSSDLSRVNSESSSPFGAFSKRKLCILVFIFSPSLINFLLSISRSFIMSSISFNLSLRESTFALPTESKLFELLDVFQVFPVP